METLAYTHSCTAHEEVNLDPSAYDLTLFNGLTWNKLPSSAWLGFLAVAVLVGSLSVMSPASAAYVSTPTGTCLNARTGPGTGYPSYICVRNGASLLPIVSRSGDWVQLSSGRWVYGPYTSAGAGSGAGSGGGSPSSGTYRVSSYSGVNVRSGPGTGYRRIGGLRNGTRVSATGYSNGWVRIASGGWVSGGYLR